MQQLYNQHYAFKCLVSLILPVEHPPDRVGVEVGQRSPHDPQGSGVMDVSRGLDGGDEEQGRPRGGHEHDETHQEAVYPHPPAVRVKRGGWWGGRDNQSVRGE